MQSLSVLLKTRYGRHKRYTEKQVRSAVEEAGLNRKYMDYALAMYMSRHDFEALKQRTALSSDYDSTRREIAHSRFEGRSSFTIHDALDAANTSSGFFSGGGFHDAGGDHGDYDSDGD